MMYNNPYLTGYNAYNPMMMNQQRLNMMEQQSMNQQFPNQQMINTPQNYTPMQQSYSTSVGMGLQGKMVDSIDVVKATDAPLDGSVSYFPITDGSAIVTKQLQTDGTSALNIYKRIDPKEAAPIETPKYVTVEEFEEALKTEPKDIKDIKDEIKAIKRQYRDLSEDIKELKKKD